MRCFTDSSYCRMANSKFEYVKQFEIDDRLLPNTWLVVRIDGRAFHRFAKEHSFDKPNDDRALRLMNQAARCVLSSFSDIILSYGQSDEFSFVFRRNTRCFNRRKEKILSNVVSAFTSAYVYNWPKHFDIELRYPPCFDGRIVAYPSDVNMMDYFAWRQADCHINNMYNYCFWKLVESGLPNSEAERVLSGTLAKDKNEILYSRFSINYNDLPALHRKGSTLYRQGGDADEAVREESIDLFRNSFIWRQLNIIKDE